MRGLHGIAAGMAIALAGCTVGPNYQRPKIDAPAAFRGPDSTAAGTADVASLGDAKWWTIFQDPELQKLIRAALDQSYDLRIAATRVMEARSQVTITRSNQFPTVNGAPLATGQRTPPISGGFPSFSYAALEAALSVSWDIDFWGKYRRATEAARANLLASDWGRKAVIGSLVANVATGYFQLRALDLQLDISKRTLAAREDSLKLTQTLADGGAASLVDVRQAEQLVETAGAAIPDLERQIQQGENQIEILLGQNPGPVARGLALTDQPLPAEVPPGIPSRLLERRPDIQEAEQTLIAANANIGVARAAFFPDLSLTALAGVESASLTTLFRGTSRTWTWTAQVTQPIFNAGKTRANYNLAVQQQQEVLLGYQQTIQKAFGDVSNALIAYRKFREEREHQERLVTAAQSASELSRLRYQGGAASYLEVLTNDTNAYSAELNLVSVRLGENAALVQIYNSLGGGWEQ
jgi:multidrug efflux system outer membrane protein